MSSLAWIFIVIFIAVSLGGTIWALRGKTEETQGSFVSWLLFNIVLGSLPVLLTLLGLWRMKRHIGINSLGSGELLIIASVVSADAAGRAIFCKTKGGIKVASLGGICAIVAIFCAAAYAQVAHDEATPPSKTKANTVASAPQGHSPEAAENTASPPPKDKTLASDVPDLDLMNRNGDLSLAFFLATLLFSGTCIINVEASKEDHQKHE